jgi:hypothetical protein
LGPINPNTLFASLQGKKGESFKEKINKIEAASGKNKGIRKESYCLNWLMCGQETQSQYFREFSVR